MKKHIVGFLMLVSASIANAQDNTGYDRVVNMEVPGNAANISAWQEECRKADAGTCIVTVGFQSDFFPVEFIQNGKILGRVTSAEDAAGVAIVRGVKYDALPNGGMKYMLEVRSPRGATFLFKQIGT